MTNSTDSTVKEILPSLAPYARLFSVYSTRLSLALFQCVSSEQRMPLYRRCVQATLRTNDVADVQPLAANDVFQDIARLINITILSNACSDGRT